MSFQIPAAQLAWVHLQLVSGLLDYCFNAITNLLRAVATHWCGNQIVCENAPRTSSYIGNFISASSLCRNYSGDRGRQPDVWTSIRQDFGF